MSMEKCENCDATIGKFETPMVWNDRVVCSTCYGRLNPKHPEAIAAIPYSALPPLPPQAKSPSSFKWGMGVTFGIFAAIVLVCAGVPFMLFGGGIALIASVPKAPARPSISPPVSTAISASTPSADMSTIDGIIQTFGPPDQTDSTENDKPRPPLPTKWLDYKKASVRFYFFPDAKPGEAPPYKSWKLLSATDLKTTQPLKAEEIISRFQKSN